MGNTLRSEARPTDWETLDSGQQRAFGRITEMIMEAIVFLRKWDEIASEQEPLGLSEWTTEERSSRIAFLSGPRGTGKSTVLASIIKASTNKKDNFIPPEPASDTDSEKNNSKKNGLKNLQTNLNRIRERVIWLEPIDMEPLPKSANLLAAILVRIEEASRRPSLRTRVSQTWETTDRKGLLEPSPDYHEALLKLQQVQTDVALAWDGNIEARKGNLDADTYAIEVMRTEHATLSLNRNRKRTWYTVA
jgi:hypothetical protein